MIFFNNVDKADECFPRPLSYSKSPLSGLYNRDQRFTTDLYGVGG